MNRFLPALLLFLVAFWPASAQTEGPVCGTETPESIHKFMEDYYQSDFKFKKGQLLYLPIKAHIMRRTNGSGGLTITELNDAIAAMNAYFINADIQFFICGEINYINNNAYFDFNQRDESVLGAANDVTGLINIYFANTVRSRQNQALCGYAYYPGGPDRIVMANSCTVNETTLSHEMGHFFALIHTHGPTNGFLTSEYVNGTNCKTAGDKICDTPADPELNNQNVTTACVYAGNITDKNGDKFEPDPANIMSYSRKSCRNLFTPQQYEVIRYTSITERNYFVCTGTLDLAQLPKQEFCGGSSAEIDFTSDYTFDATNVFSAELSDERGSFENATIIGTLTGNTPGKIPVVFPDFGPESSGHRIRIVSTNPTMFGNDNGIDINLYATPQLAVTDTLLCETETFNLSTAFTDIAQTEGSVSFWRDSAHTSPLTDPHTISNSGKYYIQKTTLKGSCQSVADIAVNFMPPPPRPTITLEGSLLVSDAEFGNQWHNLHGPMEGETGKTLQPPYNSIYWVEVSNEVCVSEPSNNYRYAHTEKLAPLYPNPVSEILYINHMPATANAPYRITDMRGRVVATGTLSPQKQQAFNLYTLARGLYLLEITDDGTTLRSKFVKL